MVKHYWILFLLKFFPNIVNEELYIINSYFKNIRKPINNNKTFKFFLKNRLSSFNSTFSKKLLSITLAQKDFLNSELLLENCQIDGILPESKFAQENLEANLYKRNSYKTSLYNTNYFAWLFFIMIEHKHESIGFVEKDFIIEKDNVQKIMQHPKLKTHYQLDSVQKDILKYCKEEQKEWIQFLFLDLFLSKDNEKKSSVIKI